MSEKLQQVIDEQTATIKNLQEKFAQIDALTSKS